ncbi:hypothetical protein O6R08_10505 [Cutibacterium equinum]|uniref:Lipoprotein n=1 Tax=Cutibacterium equinum TaxID=3016342 RepID=A0ABY7QXT6_9ACTN|nr:hypothetical protein [Cutibacterium equinum]WCC79866.1 hypothetical protein O6R08_10505 [Cutibacterium equinum]
MTVAAISMRVEAVVGSMPAALTLTRTSPGPEFPHMSQRSYPQIFGVFHRFWFRGFSTVARAFRIVVMVMNGEHAGGCRRRLAMVTAFVVVLGTAACGGDDGASGAMGGVTPVPSAVTTSSTSTLRSDEPRLVKATATPVPGTTQDALFLEAKKVYETYLEQTLLFEQEGGGEVLPAGLKDVVGGDWAEMIREYYEKVKERGHVVRPDSAGYGPVSIAIHEPKEGHALAIDSCVDQRGWEFVDASGKLVSEGTLKHNQLFFDRIDGHMVIVDGLSERGEECEA